GRGCYEASQGADVRWTRDSAATRTGPQRPSSHRSAHSRSANLGGPLNLSPLPDPDLIGKIHELAEIEGPDLRSGGCCRRAATRRGDMVVVVLQGHGVGSGVNFAPLTFEPGIDVVLLALSQGMLVASVEACDCAFDLVDGVCPSVPETIGVPREILAHLVAE